jgi:hypothetical protein
MEVRLKSRLLHSVHYEPGSQRLTITMSNGQKRKFSNVPNGVVNDLAHAKSAGAYYVKFIKSAFETTAS